MRPLIVIEMEQGEILNVFAEKNLDYIIVDRDKLVQGELASGEWEADDLMSRTRLLERVRELEEEYAVFRK